MQISEPAAVYLSLSDDESRFQAFGKFKRLSITPNFTFLEDEGFALRLSCRMEGKRMLEAIQASSVKHLIVFELSRLGRKPSELHSEFRCLTSELGMTVHFIDLGGDFYSSDNPANPVLLRFMAAIASIEQARPRKELAAQKIRNQEPVGAACFGWKNFEHGGVRMVVPEPDEQVWLKKIIHWRQVEQWSFGQIAKELNAQGVKTKQSRKWNKGTIFNLFKNQQVKQFIAQQK